LATLSRTPLSPSEHRKVEFCTRAEIFVILMDNCVFNGSCLQLSDPTRDDMFSGDQLAIGKETGRRLGMGTNMYPSSSLLGAHKDESIAALPVDELIEKADGFAGVFPGKAF